MPDVETMESFPGSRDIKEHVNIEIVNVLNVISYKKGKELWQLRYRSYSLLKTN